MFDSIGWGEIFVVILAGLIIIGPERLPGVIMDVRAAIFAARRAINDAKNELYGEEFDELRKPMSTVTEYAAMGPKRAIAKVLFDEDGDYLDQFDPRRMMEGDPAIGRNAAAGAAGASAARGTTRAADAASKGGAPQSAGAPDAPGSGYEPGSTRAPQYSEGRSQPHTHQQAERPQSAQQQTRHQQSPQAQSQSQSRAKRRRRQPGMGAGTSQSNPPTKSSGGGFSWADVT